MIIRRRLIGPSIRHPAFRKIPIECLISPIAVVPTADLEVFDGLLPATSSRSRAADFGSGLAACATGQ